MKPTEDRDRPAPRGFLGRFRELPGSRTAVVAFVLTVVLGIGGTAAYALWSQTGNASISVVAGAAKPTPPPTTPPPTTPPTTPPPTSPPPTTPTTPAPTPGGPTAIAPNVQTAWAGRPAEPTCAQVSQKDAMTIGVQFSWPNLSTATSYVVSVKSQSNNYTYTQPAQEVRSPKALFIFPENKTTREGAFYTDYLVRVMPMKGEVGGDPYYLIYRHGAWDYGCGNPSGQVNSPLGTTALTCTLSTMNNSPTADLTLRWTAAAGASSYRVSLRPSVQTTATASYGVDFVTSETSAALQFNVAAHAGQYVVRVQPMNGSTAGDPAYELYRLSNSYSHGCDGTGETFR